MFKINHNIKCIEKIGTKTGIEIGIEIEIEISKIRELIWHKDYTPINLSCDILLDRMGCKNCKNEAKVYDGDTCDKCNKFFCDDCKEVSGNSEWYCKTCK